MFVVPAVVNGDTMPTPPAPADPGVNAYLRATSLAAAVAMHTATGTLPLQVGVDAGQTVTDDETVVLATATRFLAWAHGVYRARLVPGPVRDQTTGQLTGTPTGDDPMQIHDHEQFDLSLVMLDSEGFPTTTATPPVWTTSNADAVPVNVSADSLTFSVIAGVPGSAVVTCEVTKDDGTVLTVTYAVDVVPGDVETISLSAGPVTTQP